MFFMLSNNRDASSGLLFLFQRRDGKNFVGLRPFFLETPVERSRYHRTLLLVMAMFKRTPLEWPGGDARRSIFLLVPLSWQNVVGGYFEEFG
jgi:hypothetical protein